MAEKYGPRSRRLASDMAPKFLDAVEEMLRSPTDDAALTKAVGWAQIMLALHTTAGRMD